MPMNLRCSECKAKFASLVIDDKLAFQDIYKGLMEHVMKDHKDLAESLAPVSQTAVESLVLVFTLQSFAEIDEGDMVLDKILLDAQVVVMKAIGYDPAEEVGDIDEELEGDEDEEDDDDDDDEKEGDGRKEKPKPVFDPSELEVT